MRLLNNATKENFTAYVADQVKHPQEFRTARTVLRLKLILFCVYELRVRKYSFDHEDHSSMFQADPGGTARNSKQEKVIIQSKSASSYSDGDSRCDRQDSYGKK